MHDKFIYPDIVTENMIPGMAWNYFQMKVSTWYNTEVQENSMIIRTVETRIKEDKTLTRMFFDNTQIM